jgi:hypothetical protein
LELLFPCSNDETTFMNKPKDARTRAEASFKKEQQAREGAQAWADYQAQMLALRQKTARLRALRLARAAGTAAPEQSKQPKRRAAR